jgi:hypothetical protein
MNELVTKLNSVFNNDNTNYFKTIYNAMSEIDLLCTFLISSYRKMFQIQFVGLNYVQDFILRNEQNSCTMTCI